MSKLTPREELFCLHYLESSSVPESATKAGYSQSYSKTKAYLLAKRPEIQGRLKELRSEYISTFFESTAAKALQIVTDVLENGDTSTAQLKAAELILKQAGIITDKFDINQKIEYEITFRN